jgi:pimeloyl-ACP methyl ester carboxylesterase
MQPPLKPLIGTLPSGTVTTFDGQTIAYQIYPGKTGSTPIILLHMLGRTRTDWDGFARWLQKNGYAVVVPDLRGHGQSSGNWEKFTDEDFNKMTYDVSALKSMLENQGADVTKLAIIGASIGANTALNYAATDKDVTTVILLSPGLNYRGSSTANTKFGKPFLIVASNDDKYSAESSQQIADNNAFAKLVLFEDAGHGTNMFVKPELSSMILQWLKLQIK